MKKKGKYCHVYGFVMLFIGLFHKTRDYILQSTATHTPVSSFTALTSHLVTASNGQRSLSSWFPNCLSYNKFSLTVLSKANYCVMRDCCGDYLQIVVLLLYICLFPCRCVTTGVHVTVFTLIFKKRPSSSTFNIPQNKTFEH
jgi:hypothetical protein